MEIQGSIINGVENNINLLPNQGNINVQVFGLNVFGKLVVDVSIVCMQMADVKGSGSGTC